MVYALLMILLSLRLSLSPKEKLDLELMGYGGETQGEWFMMLYLGWKISWSSILSILTPSLGVSQCFYLFFMAINRILQNLNHSTQNHCMIIAHYNNSQHKQIHSSLLMFNLIKSVLSPIHGMKIEPENQRDLQKKLHNLTQHLLISQKPFQAWMQLQSQNQLHHTLEEICKSLTLDNNAPKNRKYTQEQIALIYQFYTIVLKNSTDELLVCKLVSDDFVIKLTKMEYIPDAMLDQIEPYRINLIKAYLGTVNREVVKYMVIQDRFKVFEECVKIYKGKAGTVQQTTIANALLNIINKIDLLEYLYESIWVPSGLQNLLQSVLKNILSQIGQQSPENLAQNILFLVQINESTKKSQIRFELKQFCDEGIQDILQVIEYMQLQKQIHGISDAFVLFEKYEKEKEIVEFMLQNLDNYKLVIMKQIALNNEKIGTVIVHGLFIIAKLVLSAHSNLSCRVLGHKKTEQLLEISKVRVSLLQMYEQVIKYLTRIVESLQKNQQVLVNVIKLTFLPLFKIRLACSDLNISANFSKQAKKLDKLILEYFLVYTKRLQVLMKNNVMWNEIIRWYEDISTKVVGDLLQIGDSIEIKKDEVLQTMMLAFEYLRNYRFMIVKNTTLNPKNIKQDKSYQQNFQSPGLYFQPGSILPADTPLTLICRCLLNHNLQQIPVFIVQDKQCFIVAMKVQEDTKILMNIKFKDIDDFIYGNNRDFSDRKHKDEPKYLRINLKGMQQVNLQFPNPKQSGNAFKAYLIKSKEMCRQNQLSFLNKWIREYEQDSVKALQIIEKQEQQIKKEEAEEQEEGEFGSELMMDFPGSEVMGQITKAVEQQKIVCEVEDGDEKEEEDRTIQEKGESGQKQESEKKE